MPRATTAAWRGLAAAAGQDALGGDHAGQVVGVGLRRTRMTFSPAAARRPLGGVEDRLADGRARRGADALGESGPSAEVSKRGNISWASWRR
jgi:hypothetical protein